MMRAPIAFTIWIAAVPTPDAARVDERDAARREPTLHDQRVPRRDEHLGDGRRISHGHALRDRQKLSLVNGDALGVSAAAHDRHDGLTDHELAHPRTELDDVAGELHAGDVERATAVHELRTGIAAPSLQQVGAVEGGSRDLDDDLVGRGCRLGHIIDTQYLGLAVGLEDDRLHCVTS